MRVNRALGNSGTPSLNYPSKSESGSAPVTIKGAHSFILFYIFILLAAAAIGAVYGWQHHKVKDLDKQVKSLNSQIATLKNQSQASSAKTLQNYFTTITCSSTYTSKQEPTLSFQCPPGWKAETLKNNLDPNAEFIRFTSSSGTVIYWNSDLSGLGGYCPEKKINIVSTQPVPAAKGLFLVEFTIDSKEGFGIVDGTSPKAGDQVACPYYPEFSSHADSKRRMWLTTNTSGAADVSAVNVATADIETVKQILLSLKY